MKERCLNQKIYFYSFLGTLIGSWILLVFIVPYFSGSGAEKVPLITPMKQHYFTGHNGDWLHAAFVPFIMVFLGWKYKQRYSHLKPNPSFLAGSVLLGLTLFFYWIGALINLEYAGYVAVQFVVGALIWLFFGRNGFWKLGYFWLFLWFAWPFYFINRMVALPLRFVVTSLVESFLGLFGIDVLRQGTAIVSVPNPALQRAAGELFQIDVAAVCSGIRSLMAMVMLGALLGFIAHRSPWKRWVLFGAALPLAILGNMVRILLLMGASIVWGTKFAIGRSEHDSSLFHLGTGVAVFLVGFFGLYAISRVLTRYYPEPKSSDNPLVGDTKIRRSSVIKLCVVAGLMLGLAAGANRLSPSVKEGNYQGVKMELPKKLTGYTAKLIPTSPIEKKGLPPDTQFIKYEYSPKWAYSFKDLIRVGIVLSGRDRHSIHPPNECLVAQGWKIEGLIKRELKLADGVKIPTNLLQLKKDFFDENGKKITIKAYYLYWWVGANRSINRYSGMIFHDALDILFHRQVNRWAYPYFFAFQSDGENDDLAMDRLYRFAQKVVPVFQLPKTFSTP